MDETVNSKLSARMSKPNRQPGTEKTLTYQIKGTEDVYHEGRLIETFEYSYYIPGHKFARKATLYVDKPLIPKGYQEGFYWDILKIRLKRGEDHKVAADIEKYLNFEEPLKPLEYAGMVHMLLHSYPILKFRYQNLFDKFRRTAVVYHDRNIEKFRDCFLIVVDCLSPYSTCPVGPMENLDRWNFEPQQDPIVVLDLLYTLRVWNLRVPFSCFCLAKSIIEEAENTFFGYDMVKYAKLISGPFSAEIEQYVEEKEQHNVLLEER